jgi:hypothetical protein
MFSESTLRALWGQQVPQHDVSKHHRFSMHTSSAQLDDKVIFKLHLMAEYKIDIENS